MTLEQQKILHRLGRQQHEVVATRQLTERGIASSTIASWARGGLLVRARRGVHSIGGPIRTRQQAVMAAVLAAGPGAGASHETAALLHGFVGEWSPNLEVTVPRDRNARIAGVVVHRSGTWSDPGPVLVDQIPTATPTRAWIELGPRMDGELAGLVLDDLLRRRMVGLDEVREQAHRLLVSGGRMRCGHLLGVLDERGPEQAASESRWEDRLADILVRAGLPEPVRQHRVVCDGHHFRLDLAYPEHRIAIEFDGYEGHGLRSRFDADRRRQVLLEDAGWRVLPFTSRSSETFVVRHVGRALRRSAAA